MRGGGGGGGGGGTDEVPLFSILTEKNEPTQDVYYIISSVFWSKQRKQTIAPLKHITHKTLACMAGV